MIPNYNQQDAKFLDFFISTDALQVSGGFYSYVHLMMGGGTAWNM